MKTKVFIAMAFAFALTVTSCGNKQAEATEVAEAEVTEVAEACPKAGEEEGCCKSDSTACDKEKAEECCEKQEAAGE